MMVLLRLQVKGGGEGVAAKGKMKLNIVIASCQFRQVLNLLFVDQLYIYIYFFFLSFLLVCNYYKPLVIHYYKNPWTF